MAKEGLRGSTLALNHFYEVRGVARRELLGTVYLAEAQPFARPVWVWVLDQLLEMGASDALVDRLRQRFDSIGGLSAESTLRLLDFGQVDEQTPFLVYDAVDGRSLEEQLHLHGPFSLWQVLRVLEQLAESVREAHAAGLHGLGLDLSRVILLDPERCSIRCYGHGLCLSREDIQSLPQARLEHALMRPIPPSAFLSAEQGESVSAPPPERGLEEADIYALAALCYQLLTGQHPYFRDERELSDGVLAILRESPIPTTEYGCSEAVERVLRPALGQEAMPYHDVASFVAAFRAAVDAESRARAERARQPQWGNAADELLPKRCSKASRAPWSTGLKALSALVLALLLSNAFTLYQALRTPVWALSPIPEYAPAAENGEGVDLVLHTYLVDAQGEHRATPVDVYQVSRHGDTLLIGQTPMILRQQQEEARLRFVLAGDGVATQQLDVRIDDRGGRSMILGYELEREYARSASLSAAR
ncbi:MAG: hypothetical protein RBU37_21280 [Myxococcota bacterium]|nr:hypothetical protein [Myxococcota bacterium]